ncbi:MAG: Rieske 2Fe-2S domain-containing protein [Nitrospira sp.]|nr:Rieske 2Fe-2S domain-containing protein [Nitrospira sp.]
MKLALCKLEDIPDDKTKTVDFFGREVLVFTIHGKPKAVLNMCMHLGGPMRRDGNKLICEWHAAEFECGQGKCLKGPADRDSRLITLPTQVENGTLTYVYGE